MWKSFKCRFFRHHDYQLCREPGALFLECRRCGHRSHGWKLSETRVKRDDSPLRLFIAEPYEVVPAVRAGDRTGSAIWAPLMDAGELRLTFGRDD
jgi:hypothetical protein